MLEHTIMYLGGPQVVKVKDVVNYLFKYFPVEFATVKNVNVYV